MGLRGDNCWLQQHATGVAALPEDEQRDFAVRASSRHIHRQGGCYGGTPLPQQPPGQRMLRHGACMALVRGSCKAQSVAVQLAVLLCVSSANQSSVYLINTGVLMAEV